MLRSSHVISILVDVLGKYISSPSYAFSSPLHSREEKNDEGRIIDLNKEETQDIVETTLGHLDFMVDRLMASFENAYKDYCNAYAEAPDQIAMHNYFSQNVMASLDTFVQERLFSDRHSAKEEYEIIYKFSTRIFLNCKALQKRLLIAIQ